jgi:hypothetical protein
MLNRPQRARLGGAHGLTDFLSHLCISSHMHANANMHARACVQAKANATKRDVHARAHVRHYAFGRHSCGCHRLKAFIIHTHACGCHRLKAFIHTHACGCHRLKAFIHTHACGCHRLKAFIHTHACGCHRLNAFLLTLSNLLYPHAYTGLVDCFDKSSTQTVTEASASTRVRACVRAVPCWKWRRARGPSVPLRHPGAASPARQSQVRY